MEAKGRCYEFNGRAITGIIPNDIEMPFSEDERGNLHIVHGVVTMRGEHEGELMGHCWLENDKLDLAYDFSVGEPLVVPKEIYYMLAGAQMDKRVRYTENEYRRLIVEHEHWGPFVEGINPEESYLNKNQSYEKTISSSKEERQIPSGR